MDNKIRKRRKELGLKQYELAERLDVSVTTVNNWENGRNKPPIRKYVKVAKALDCKPSDLIEL